MYLITTPFNYQPCYDLTGGLIRQTMTRPVAGNRLAENFQRNMTRVKSLAIEDIGTTWKSRFLAHTPHWDLKDALTACPSLEQLFVVQARVTRHETLPLLTNRLFGGRGIPHDDKVETWEWISCEEADLVTAYARN